VYTLFDAHSHGPLNAKLIFVSLALFNKLRQPLSQFPTLIHALIEASVSYDRIREFLLREQINEENVKWGPRGDGGPSDSQTPAIVVRGGEFRWLRDGPSVLRELNFHVAAGSLFGIVGKIGEWQRGPAFCCHAAA
jgi:ABC-type multidrug transport system fused ATPase/permease subunit